MSVCSVTDKGSPNTKLTCKNNKCVVIEVIILSCSAALTEPVLNTKNYLLINSEILRHTYWLIIQLLDFFLLSNIDISIKYAKSIRSKNRSLTFYIS